MKLIFFRTKIKDEHKTGIIRRINFERLLFLFFIALFSLLAVIQAALTNPSARTFLTWDNELEGTPLGSEETFFKEGNMSLKLIGQDSNPDIKILVNGDEAAVFNSNIINITVKDGDVVEVDGSLSGNPAEVQVCSKSKNILTECVGKHITINSDIEKVADIKIE